MKTFKYANFKHFVETLVSDIKKPIPTLTGKETTFDFCKDSLALLGYRTEVYLQDLNYLGEKVKDFKSIHIKIKEDSTHKIVKEKSSMVNLGWTWKHAKDIFSLIKGSIDPIKQFDKNADRAIDDLDKFKESIMQDFKSSYTERVGTTGGVVHNKRLDERGKKTLYLYENVFIQHSTLVNIYLKIISACMDNVMIYYTILSKGKLVK